MTNDVEARPSRLTLPSLFLKFLCFGLLAFGGPVAQIAMIREALVERERWIDGIRFNRLLAVLQALPGPEAHELCVHLGMVARGRIGGILAGLGFMLPGFLLMLLAGWLYVTALAGLDGLSGPMLGVQIAVLAIILWAVVRIGRHVVEDRMLAGIAVATFALTLAGAPFPLLLAAAGAAYIAADRPLLIALIASATVAVTLAVPAATSVAASAAASPVTTGALFAAGLKGGLLTFGGAYTAIPYVRADTVGRGWIDDGTFLDGVALAGLLPAPLVIFATFVGYVAGGLAGALAITAGMFLPAFAFSLILFERLEALVASPALHRLLSGLAAAVVGIIAATFVDLARGTARQTEAPLAGALLFLAASIVAWRFRGPWVSPAIVAGGALAGWAVAS